MSDKTFTCRADGCGIPFPSASAVRSHRRTAHPVAQLPLTTYELKPAPEIATVQRIKGFCFDVLEGNVEHGLPDDVGTAFVAKILRLCEVPA